MRQVILASGSPRRKELLKNLVRDFTVIPSDIPEVAAGTPVRQVEKLAADKAKDIAEKHSEAIVIGADTIVVIGKTILGKPRDAADAARMLEMLSGKTHKVYTGVAVVCDEKTIIRSAVTKVTFNSLGTSEIDEYIKTGEPMDKAGAYGIQGYGGKFIKKIDGCYFNVMGFPQSIVYEMLKEIEV